jgi:alcohol dehydrogenase class IV
VELSFDFATAGRILAGPGRARELPGVLAGLGSRFLVVKGRDPARHNALLASLDGPAAVFSVPGEPTVELVRAAVKVARAARRAFGLRPQDVDDIAAKALVSSSMKGNPVPLSHADLRAIILQAL